MPRRRRSRRSYIYRPVKTAKYSNETLAFVQSIAYSQNSQFILVSPSTSVLGTRKAKNFTLTFFGAPATVWLFALIFVPEGTRPNNLSYGNQIDAQTGDLLAADLYNPSQNVILQGLLGGLASQAGVAGGQIYRFKTRLARNLNAGDRLMIALKPLSSYEGNAEFVGTLNYAISY